MPQQPPVHDETVRMRPDGPSGRPTLDGPRVTPPAPATCATPVHAQAAGTSGRVQGPTTAVETPADSPEAAPGASSDDRELDDTRPVSREWLRSPPEAGAPADGAPAHDATADDATGVVATEPVGGRQRDTQPVGHHATAPVDTLPTAPPGPGDGTADDATRMIEDRDGDGPDTPGGPPSGDEPPAGGSRGPWWRRTAVLAPAAAVAVLAAAYGVDLLVSSGEIPRNTVVAGVDIGGLSPAAAAEALERDLAPRVVADHTVVADDVEATLSPASAGIGLDVDATVDAAAEQPLNPWTRLVTLFTDRAVDPEITGDETALSAQIETVAALVDRAPVDATIVLENTTPSLVEPADGRVLDREGSAAAITEALASGGDPATPIELPVDIEPVRVDTEEAQRVLDETVVPALAAPVTVTSADGAISADVPPAAIAAGLTFTPQDDGELAVSIDPAKLQTAIGDGLGVFGTPAEDARFEVDGGAVSVVPSVDGTGVDPALLSEQLLGVLTDPAPRTVTAELGPVPAEFTTEEAEALGIREEISSFTTNFTSTASGTNIRVVAEEVDGALILPGETFSLNTFTGPRGTAQGYVPAAVISGGELSTAVGGGISQFATTMFNAVFFAGLEDVYHKPHSFYISRYPAGREATVYEGVIDLVWKNDTDTGVFVDTQWVPGAITVTFYGTKRYEIESISSERTNYREPAVQEKVDDGECTPQGGIPGFDITVTRVFRDLTSGAEIRRENFHTSYAAEAVIHCVPPPAPPAPGQQSTPPASPSSPGGRRPGGRRPA
jgi:vancomycin resistance protein YoaR